MLDLDNDNFRPRNDIVRQLAYCENGSSIELVVVAGNIVCRDGQLATVREQDVWGELNQLLPAYLEDHGRWEVANRVFEPCFSEVVRRCKETEIGLQR